MLAGLPRVCRSKWIIAQLADVFQRHAVRALDGPFVVLLHEGSADEAGDNGLIGDDGKGSYNILNNNMNCRAPLIRWGR